MIRWLARGALILLLVLAALLAALPWLAGPLLKAGLHAAGFEAVDFDEARLGLTSAEVRGVALGEPPQQRLERMTLRYRPRDLLEPRLRRVEIEGLRVRARLTPDGLTLAGLETGGDGDLAGTPPLPAIETVEVRDAHLDIETPIGELHLPVRADIRPENGAARFTLAIDRATLVTDRGTARADLSLDGTLPLTGRPGLDAATLDGTLAIDAADIALEGVGRDVTAAGTIALAMTAGVLEARSDDLTLGIGAPAPALGATADVLPPPWRFTFGAPERPMRVTVRLAGDGRVDLAGPVALETAGPTLSATLAAVTAADRGVAIDAVRSAEARLEVRSLRWQGLEVDEAHVQIDAEATLDGLRGAARIDLDAAGEAAPGLRVAGLSLQQSLDLTLAESALTVRPGAEGTLRLESLTAADRFRAGPLSARIDAAERPLLRLDRAADGDVRWDGFLAAAIAAFTAEIRGDGTPVAVSGQVDRLEVALEGDAGGLGSGNLVVADATVRLPAQAMRFEGVRTELGLADAGLVAEPIPLEIAAIRHGADPAWFRPLSLSGEITPTGERLAFTATLTGAAGALTISIDGTHDPAAGAGRAAVRLAPLAFAADGLQPARLWPVLGDGVEAVSGRLSADGALAWSASGLSGDLNVLAEALGLTVGPARLEQINGIVRFDRILPPATPPGQLLAIGELNLGLPFTDGLITFTLEPAPALEVEALRFRWAGGTLRADPFRVGSGDSGFTVVLHADGLDLARIFEQVRLPGLSGKGTITGTLPIRLVGTEAVIEGGELRAERPGSLLYRPASPPAALQAGGESMDLLLQALENFEYESLRITLDGRTDSEMDIGLHIEGANPELYDGHPIEFNLNLEGELANVLRSGLSSYQIPERIRERMQEFRR